MSIIAGLQDLRKQGPPGDTGIFQKTASVIVFKFTFSGTTLNVAMRVGVRGWQLIDYGSNARAVIQSAHDDLTRGGIICILRGTYTIDAQITVTNTCITIFGEGQSTVLVFADNVTDGTVPVGMFYVTGDYFKISDLYLNGNSANNPTSPTYGTSGVVVVGDYAEITRIVVDDFPDLNIVCYGGSHHRIECCLSLNAGRDGIAVDNADYVDIIGNVIRTAGDKSIGWAFGADYINCVGNICSGAVGDNIAALTGLHPVIANNLILSGGRGLRVEVEAAVIIGNQIRGSRRGIELRGGATRCIVQSNFFYDIKCNSSNWAAVVISAGHVHFIHGNYFWQISPTDNWYTIYVAAGSGHIITNNAIRDNRGTRVAVRIDAGVSGVWLKNNYYSGNLGGNVGDSGTDTKYPEFFTEVNEPDGTIGRHRAKVLTDGLDVTVPFEVLFPLEFQGLISARAIVVPLGSGDFYFGVQTDIGKICSGEKYDTHQGTLAPRTQVVGISNLECIGLSAALTSVAAGDIVGGEFTRYGSNGSDTVDAACYYLGLQVQYI